MRLKFLSAVGDNIILLELAEAAQETDVLSISYDAGDWLEYEVLTTTAGTYDITFRTACLNNPGRINFLMDGGELFSIDVPVTGGWQNWVSVSAIRHPSRSGWCRTIPTPSIPRPPYRSICRGS